MSYIDHACDENSELTGLRVVIEFYDALPNVDNIKMYIERSHNGEYRASHDATAAYLFSDYAIARRVAVHFRDTTDASRIIYIDKQWIGSDGEYWQIVCMRKVIKTLVDM